MSIRKAIAADEIRITSLFKRLIEFQEKFNPVFTLSESGHERYAKRFIELINEDYALPLVAECNGVVVGFCISLIRKRAPFWKQAEYGEISDISVTTEYQRQGLGSELVRQSLDWFRSLGIQRIEVQVSSLNEVASKFWSKLGMKPYLNTLYIEE